MADGPSSSGDTTNRAFRKRPYSHSQRRPTPAKRPANASSTMSSPFSTTAAASSPADASAQSAQMPFTELSKHNLHRDILKSVTQGKGLVNMTPVQAETLPITLRGLDVLAQAKTGTGKTIAFLLPAIQRLIATRRPPKMMPTGPAAAPRQVSLLVISPTRELAIQIANEAKELLGGLQDSSTTSKYNVLTAIGGTNAKAGVTSLKRGCDILVATPGRLLDYMGEENVLRVLDGVQTLVLDEADRLLDMGFIRDIQKIIGLLPDRSVHKRQSMLFSATIDQNVHKVASHMLSPGYKLVNTVPEGEPQTHERVSQRLITVDSFADLAPATLGAVAKDMESSGSEAFKAIVFVPTTAHVDLYTAFFEALAWDYKFPQILPIHGRMTQSKRTNTANKYRESNNGILIATDVIARGLDFPKVTHIYQTGLPDEKASYIHRLGRTARAGAEGSGTLLLTQDESRFAKNDLSEVDFKDAPPTLTTQSSQVADAMQKVPLQTRNKAYSASLGYYKSKLKAMRLNATQLVKQMNAFSLEGMYLPEIPALQKTLIGKMGLKGIPGLRIAERTAEADEQPRNRRR